MSTRRVVAVSDLHKRLPQIPPCDLLIIAGDITSIFDDVLTQEAFLRGPVMDWLARVPAGAIVAVSGNHEMVADAVMASLPWTYLAGAGAEIAGLRVHGLPYLSPRGDWRYQDGLGRYLPDDLPPRFAAVPEGLDILVVHEPPLGILDSAGANEVECGSAAVRWTIERARPRLVVCGHIHAGFGRREHRGSVVLNAALAGHDDRPVRAPVVIDLEVPA